MPILSNSIYGSSVSRGVGGLMSGLDTDELVKQMTTRTRTKIDRQYQSKQKLLYKQEAYREISSKLVALSSKYFSYSAGSKTNILSPRFFEADTFKSSSSYVNVTGNANNIKNFEITDISSVATAASFASKNPVSTKEFGTSNDMTKNVSRLAGETFSISIPNEKVYSFTIDRKFEGDNIEDVDTMLTELNKKLDEVNAKLVSEGKDKVSFGINSDGKFEITGGGVLSAASKEFLSVFKMNVAGKDNEGKIGDEIVETELYRTATNILGNDNEYITFEYNGVLKQIKLNSEITDSGKLADHLQTELDKAFGSGKITVDKTTVAGKITFKATGDDNALGLNTNNVLGVSSISKHLSMLTGLQSGDYNRINRNIAIDGSRSSGLKTSLTTGTATNDKGEAVYKIDVNGKEILIAKGTSLNDIIKKINAESDVNISYSSTTDTFSAVSKETGAHKKVSITDLDGGNLATALFGTAGTDYTAKNGTDTELTYKLNGISTTITRSSANISVEEINIELNEKAKDIDFSKPITFDVTNNSDEVVEKVKKFIEEYNEIIDLLGTKTKEKPKRDYPPLTPEQQDDMKEDEIKNWNLEAKKGVLYSDSKMNSALRELKSAMGSFTDVSTLNLAAIGISSARMDTSGKLVFDEKKFKEKLLENPDEIKNLFTGESSKGEDGISGIAVQLKKVLVKNVGEYGNTGLLIDEAGLPGGMTADKNLISEKIKDHDDKMKDLKRSLEVERKRYWNQFAQLEKAMSRLNAQGSWLTNMTGN